MSRHALEIRIEVWLPKDTWNGRYRGEGGGGYAGQISYGGLAAGIRAGYATASTDTGHPASAGGTFALNPDGTLNTQLIIDFAERSLRELAMKAKAAISRHEFVLTGLAAAAGSSLPVSAQPADLATLTLRQASDLLRRKDASPVELTQACLARIDRAGARPRLRAGNRLAHAPAEAVVIPPVRQVFF